MTQQPAIRAEPGIQAFNRGRGEPPANGCRKNQEQRTADEHGGQTHEPKPIEQAGTAWQRRDGALGNRNIVTATAAATPARQGTETS
jgi:hypothetical protein